MTNYNPGYKLCKTRNSINTLETNSYQSIRYENVFFVFYLLSFYGFLALLYLFNFILVLCNVEFTEYFSNLVSNSFSSTFSTRLSSKLLSSFLRLKALLKF